MLANYTLNNGICLGLSQAFAADTELVHSFIFDSCGTTDEMLAVLLEGMLNLDRIKSFIYRRGEFGMRSAELLAQCLTRFPPDSLDEIRIERCTVDLHAIKYLLKALGK
jgi:hypothetical protein